jgi:CMP-N-acetylneuraminic acid synthetase
METGKMLVTICARGGSQGLPGKNIKPLLGKPMIAHTIEQAKRWRPDARIVVSTDSREIADVARSAGAEVPFVRPDHLATSAAGKLEVITHAFEQAEKAFGERYDWVVDLDVTSPMRTTADLERGLETFKRSGKPVCFSVVRARKNPYFNMVERGPDGKVGLVKPLGRSVLARQAAPQVWDMNASIYFFSRDFLLSRPQALWEGECEMFEMPKESAFDVDEEVDFVVVEALMRFFGKK